MITGAFISRTTACPRTETVSGRPVGERPITEECPSGDSKHATRYPRLCRHLPRSVDEHNTGIPCTVEDRRNGGLVPSSESAGTSDGLCERFALVSAIRLTLWNYPRPKRSVARSLDSQIPRYPEISDARNFRVHVVVDVKPLSLTDRCSISTTRPRISGYYLSIYGFKRPNNNTM